MATIWTVGHSTLEEAAFIEMLRAHGIDYLMDVRRYPGSRRHPHFSREHLEKGLPAAGIAYEHMPALGGRRTPSPDSPNTAWRSASFRAYADHMTDADWLAAVAHVLDVAAAHRSALMCAEAVPWRCHRQLIADWLVAHGHEVLNITSTAAATPHRLNPQARLLGDGTLRYDVRSPESDEQGSLW